MRTIFIAVEDELSEYVASKIIHEIELKPVNIQVFRRGGYGYLKKNLTKFLEIANREIILLITDLDKFECPAVLVKNWMEAKKYSHNFVFRVAVREVESWILADREAFAEFLSLKISSIPINPDQLVDPKMRLIELAKISKKRELKAEIVPQKNSTAKQGFGYNYALKPFVEQNWSAQRAAKNSDSLNRALNRIQQAFV